MLRKRLFSLLDKARDCSLIYITSPPGSGKTTLITSYLDSCKTPFSWYTVDAGDEDIATFFHYMGLASEKIASRDSKPLPIFTPEHNQAIPVFSKRYFENIFSRVVTPFIFVFDNYQDVAACSAFHEMMSHGLAEIPAGINVIILSRKEPPLQFSRMQVNGKMHLMRWDHIRFRIDEMKEFVRMKGSGKLNNEALHYLYKKTEGWVAGLLIMLESFKRDNIEYRSPDGSSWKGIFDYFACEIFQRIDEETRIFLTKTAFLPMMTVDMAQRLSGIATSEKILDILYEGSYFTERYIEEKVVYRYHPLFREFLLSRAEESLSPSDLSSTKKSAAVLLEKAGREEDAMQLFRELGDTGSLTQSILKCASSLVRQGRYQTLLKWLDSIPDKVLSDNPWLLYWKGVCRLPFNPRESFFYFADAFDKFRPQKETGGAFLAWTGIVESVMYGYESLAPLDRWFSTIGELTKEFRGFPSEDIEARVACAMARAASLRRPADVDMKEWVDRIHRITPTAADIYAQIRCLISLACYQYSEGNFQSLGITLKSLGKLLDQHDIPALGRLTVDWVKAAYFNAMSMYDECRKVVSEGLKLARGLRINLTEYLLLGHGVTCSLKTGDLETVKKYLQIMALGLSSAKPWEASFYHYCSAWEALYRNDFACAATHSEHCMIFCEESGNPWTLSMAYVLKSYVCYVFGEYKSAIENIDKARTIGIRSKNEFTPFVCWLTEAYFHLKQGKKSAALAAIRKGMKLGHQKGFVNLFMWLPGVMECVAAKALEHGIEVTYVEKLIRRNSLLPDTSHLEIENWPWPLKIYTLSRFSIIKDGKPIQFAGKAQQKPLTMLKALIALGGRDVNAERLSDILWPEAEGDAAYSACTTTIFRLRQILGVEPALRLYEGKVFLDPRYCCVDVWALERILGKADAAWAAESFGTDGKQAVKLAEKAMKMYTGTFLAGDDEPWLTSMRERLRNKFLRNIRRLGHYWELSRELNNAVECYQKGLEVDNLQEEFYRRIMKCYQQMGKRGEAIAVYDKCRQVLSAVLGIKPSSETEAVMAELLKR
jgi:LuxR family maltose regulon positive regulatory protein